MLYLISISTRSVKCLSAPYNKSSLCFPTFIPGLFTVDMPKTSLMVELTNILDKDIIFEKLKECVCNSKKGKAVAEDPKQIFQTATYVRDVSRYL